MKKFSMFTALAAVLVSMFALVGQASASTWQSNGPITFSATASTGTKLTVGGVVLSCTSSTATGTVAAGGVTTATWTGAATTTPAFSTCTSAGVGYSVACNDGGTGFPKTNPAAAAASLNALQFNGGVTVANAAAAVGKSTTGSLTSVTCDLGITATRAWCKSVTGSVAGSYTNPTTVGGTNGVLTINSAGQSLTVAALSGQGTCSAIPTGSGAFASSSGGNITYNNATTSASPEIWQQP